MVRALQPHERKIVSSLKSRFYEYAIPSENGCLEWSWVVNESGPIVPGGIRARRLSHLMHIGGLPDRTVFVMSCNNEKCVHPAHIKEATRACLTYLKKKKVNKEKFFDE